MSRPISRRSLLRGLGTAVALPMLDAMLPRTALAATAAKAPPTRMLWVYTPNGINMADWTPKGVGADFELPQTLSALKDFRQQMLVLSGLTDNQARAFQDGGGDHARALASFLTGCHPRKTDGLDLKAGLSVDQVAADRQAGETRLPSLELGCQPSAGSGNCDSGYSCAYSSNMSWRNERMPMPKEINPRLVFERLFSAGPSLENGVARDRRQRYRKSVLDFVRDDAGQLQRQLGGSDVRKLDEYLTSVREIERRLQRAEREPPPQPPAGMSRPSGIPNELSQHLRLLFDLLAVAWQCDLTRVATLVIANEGNNGNYSSIGIHDGHHELSHHQGNAEKQAKLARIDRFHLEQFAYFLGKLRQMKEADGTLLDHSLCIYGSAIADGNAHNHDNLPILMAGGGSGTVRTGRHVVYPRETPLTNLWLSMLDRIGTHPERLGDSTGRLPQLDSAS